MHPTNLESALASAAAVLAALLLSLPTARAQSTQPTQPEQAAPETGNPPAETVTLDPFEVKADSDTSYGALSSRSITAFNTALDSMPVSADIFDQTFMNDVGATSVEDVLTFSASEGVSSLNAGATAANIQPDDSRGMAYQQLRGMQIPNMQRDSLLYLGSLGGPGGNATGLTSTFDLDRVEVIFGPEALLYDGGGAGGVINTVTKQAHFDAPATGSDSFMVDQYGTKYNTFDFSAGSDHIAVRVAGIDSTDDTRRTSIYNTLSGLYTQFAARFGNTTLRLGLEQTFSQQYAGSYLTLVSTSDPTYSAYNSYALTELVAQGKAGPIAGGLDWSNVNSLEGNLDETPTLSEFGEIEADTQWTSWLSTQISGGLSNWFSWADLGGAGAFDFYSPGASSNPLPGNWTMGFNNALSLNNAIRPFHGKAGRVSVLANNDLFGGRAKSQTILGTDYVGNRGGVIPYAYYLADSNWNVVTNAGTTDLGRTQMPELNYTVNNGPVFNPLFPIGAPRVTVQGQNYVLEQANPFVKADVSPGNPLGDAIGGGQNARKDDDVNDGAYLTNYTQWLDGKLDTLLGVRLEHSYEYLIQVPTALGTGVTTEDTSHNFNFDVGADYHLLPWLTPYFDVSNSYLMPPQVNADSLGNVIPPSDVLGGEVGFKINVPASSLSGSVALYHNQATNEEFQGTAALVNDINPTGLNGKLTNNDISNYYAADSESDGLQVTLTANPVKNWRLRLSAAFADGRIQTSQNVPQVYNDQFHENAAGDVTYADGTVVYVASTFNSKTPAYTSADAPAGSVPLTVTSMSTPSNLYYANPNLTSGLIGSGSDAAKVLTSTDADVLAHGSILTGAVGLPIADFQLVPSLIPGLSIPGTIPVAVAGEHTTGYPELSVVFTSVYEIPNGPLEGFEFGGTVTMGWKDLAYYYYPAGLPAGSANFTNASAFYMPTYAILNPIFGYTRKIGRITFSSRLNISNVFNHYEVVMYPDEVDGYTVPADITAGFNQQPRMYQWTNTIKF